MLNFLMVLGVISIVFAMYFALTTKTQKAFAWVYLILCIVVSAVLAYDLRSAVLTSYCGTYFQLVCHIIMIIIFFIFAFAMKEEEKGFGGFLGLAMMIVTIVMLILGCDFHKAELPVEEEPVVATEEYASELERYASSLSEEQLLAAMGYPQRFKDTSLNSHRSKRVKKTNLKDAITYKWGDTEPEMIAEILSNPIYLQSLDFILRDLNIVGKSNWAKDFAKYNYQHWVDGQYVTKDYHIIACRYLIVFKAATFVEKSKNYQPDVHYGLDLEYEEVKHVNSSSKLKSNWQVYKFVNYPYTYKDGTFSSDSIIGFSCNDGRFAILKKGQKTASKKNTGGSKANVDASNAKANVGASAPTIPIIPEFDWNQMPPAVPYTPEPLPTPVDPTPYAPGEIGLEVNRIPDYYGNAPVGGFGSGVDNLTAGTLQPSEPAHVYTTPPREDDTRITYKNSNGGYSNYSTKGVDRTDSNKPSSAPVQSSNTTTYSTAGTTTSSKNTGNTAIDDVNDGVVDGF